MSSEMFSTPGQCRTPDCEVTLMLGDDENTKLFVCKHTLVKESDYFHRMFYGEGNFRERETNQVQIQDVTKFLRLTFLSWVTEPKTPLPLSASSLCALITLSDRFACPALEKELTKHLNCDNMFHVLETTIAADDKLKLLEVADKHKGEGGCILEVCIRLCANLDIEKLCTLTGKISVSSLAAAYAMVGRAMTERFQSFLGELPSHACEVTMGIQQGRFQKISCSFDCHYCKRSQNIQFGPIACHYCKRSQNIQFGPIASGKIKQIKVEKELLLI